MKKSAYEIIKEKQKKQKEGVPQSLQSTPKNSEWEPYLSFFNEAPRDTSINKGINDAFDILHQLRKNGSYTLVNLHTESVCAQDLSKIEAYLKELRQIIVATIEPFNLSYMDEDALAKLTESESHIRDKLKSSIQIIDSNREEILKHALSVAKIPGINIHMICSGLAKIEAIAESSNSDDEKLQLLSVVKYLDHMGIKPLESV
ncbi:hypothetical protein [Cerasicoccus fimbriatus]|uniref:hypothetical protein n=1 Tax=Cerasicoccus fimbriatus TaxID=3014554 RepID=UPI0022B2B0EF|nr:hypothetical protein [Cerasicoccus sp. TK19100]